MFVFAVLLIAIDPEGLGWAGGVQGAAAWGLVAVTCSPLFLAAYEIITYIGSIDELMARMQIRAAAIAALVVLLVGAVLGMADAFGLLPAINMALLLPLAAMVHGAAGLWQEYRMR